MAGLDAETRKMVLETLTDYAKKRLPHEFLREHDRENRFPAGIMKEMYDPEKLGINLLMIPEQYGGLGGASFDIYRVCEVLARIDLGIATSVFATFLGTDPIFVGGSEEQKAKWIGQIAKNNSLVAYGATEAEAGSDLVSLKTRAEHVMKDGKLVGYKITGSKQWISNGGVADVYTILARAPGGPSWFIVENGTEGFIRDKDEDKHGIRLSNTAPLSLNEVFVPVDYLIGGVEGQGLAQAQAVFGYTRLMVAALGLGAGWAAVENAVRYSQTRVQAGGPLSEKQGYTHKLIVQHAARLEACRTYIEDIARRLDGGEAGLQTEGAIAKYLSTETGNKAADDAIQALGGYGYTKDFPVEKIKRDVKITCIYEGTSEVLEMTIFRGRWQEHMKSRGGYYLGMAQELTTLHAKCPSVGADAAAAGLEALSKVLEECRVGKLTRNQYLTLRLGELIAFGETAASFCRAAAAESYSEAVLFDREAWQAMCRIHAREAASRIANEGVRLVAGASDKDGGEFGESLGLRRINGFNRGWVADMDLVAKKLNETFKVEVLVAV
ncbi:MAG: acyl-CoA dehydrogenase [Elusimicrobia bacterium GWA2_69_24]|nr:MAG: acyl-CoA dehydrogenase [Elusimicrobia bacterium GWA2_69_24]HBL16367.1 acyl-CoA dehydrogenase [Elusimicrobiota bacterium]